MIQPTDDARSGGRAARRMQQGATWAEVAELGEAAFRLRLGGLFRAAWLSGLCNRLAHQRISIDHTHARLTLGDTWIAELHLLALPGAADPLGLPYLDLAADDDASPGPGPAAALSLDGYRVVASTDHGGTLMLTLEAVDSLGLLGALLASLAALSLFPIELHIETHAGRAQDCLWLAAAGGVAPSEEAREALEALLSGCLARPKDDSPLP